MLLAAYRMAQQLNVPACRTGPRPTAMTVASFTCRRPGGLAARLWQNDFAPTVGCTKVEMCSKTSTCKPKQTGASPNQVEVEVNSTNSTKPTLFLPFLFFGVAANNPRFPRFVWAFAQRHATGAPWRACVASSAVHASHRRTTLP